MKITFHGAAKTVTGSKHLITLDDGFKVLLDCGMFQGRESQAGRENRHLGFDPAEINLVLLSHAHIDHSGLLPLLVKQGFSGAILCTEATRSLCEIMLPDSAQIQESDAQYRRRKLDDHGEPPLYTMEDATASLKLFEIRSYNEWHSIHPRLEIMFTHNGHILGSAAITLRYKSGQGTQTLHYTADIGRENASIVRAPEPFPASDYIICESTYGDRLHEPLPDMQARLLSIVRETCVKKRGKLIIPAFSIGRTQEVVFALDQLETAGKLPPIPVYVDSPLSTNATQIFQRHPEGFNAAMLQYMKKDANPFGFEALHYTRNVEESKMINSLDEPCIIISASGMAEAGRIVHHIRNGVTHAENTILLVGYCEPSTLGGRLIAGAKYVSIFGDDLPVRAQIEYMASLSAHADYLEMIAYLGKGGISGVKQIFLVHGREEAMLHFSEALSESGFKKVSIPNDGESFALH